MSCVVGLALCLVVLAKLLILLFFFNYICPFQQSFISLMLKPYVRSIFFSYSGCISLACYCLKLCAMLVQFRLPFQNSFSGQKNCNEKLVVSAFVATVNTVTATWDLYLRQRSCSQKLLVTGNWGN